MRNIRNTAVDVASNRRGPMAQSLAILFAEMCSFRSLMRESLGSDNSLSFLLYETPLTAGEFK